MADNTGSARPADWRHIDSGWEIPTDCYCDQPCVVKTDDEAWLCVLTTGPGREGHPGQHVAAMRSTDCGRSWSPPAALEPADGPEASYGVLLKTPGGRVYCFYNHNTDNVREVPGDDPPFAGGVCRRVDSLGYFVFKFSDDHGRTWSNRRYPISVREMAIDRENACGGKVRFFWNVGRPFTHAGCAYVPLHKVGGFGDGFFTRSEGVLLESENLLTESDPKKITWRTLPDGDAGLRAPPGGGPIAEEHSFVVLSDGTFYCVYRTIDGHPAYASSRDGGHTFDEPRYQCYADGRLMKHPRAANFVWKCADGKYLYWFHNHGGHFIRQAENRGTFGTPYHDRNPAWLCGGVEIDTREGKTIQWSQPEIVLYDDDPHIRMSYPDLVEEAGRCFLTETQKLVARVHEIAPDLPAALWGQFDNAAVATAGLMLDLPGGGRMPKQVEMPALPVFLEPDASRGDYGARDLRQGFSIDLWVRFKRLAAGQRLLDSRTDSGRGLCLRTTRRETLQIVLNDGRSESRWDCDAGVLHAGRLHHVAVIVDGGPKIISFLVDGVLCDGGASRQFGWGRFSPNLRHANGGRVLRIDPDRAGEIEALRIYSRYLRTSEAISNFRAGL